MGGCFFVKKMKTIKGVLPQRTKPQEIVLKNIYCKKSLECYTIKLLNFMILHLKFGMKK